MGTAALKLKTDALVEAEATRPTTVEVVTCRPEENIFNFKIVFFSHRRGLQEGGWELAEAEADDIIFLNEVPVVVDQAEDLRGEGELEPGREEGKTDQDDVDQGEEDWQSQDELQH